MADQLFGHFYVHYTQTQLKTILNKASVDAGDADTKEELFRLAQALEVSLPDRNRRALDQLVDGVVLQRKWLITAESELETMISRISVGEDDGCDDEEEEEEVAETMNCQVCLEDLPLTEFSSNTITRGCDHEAEVCISCVRQHISVHLQENPVDTLACPLCVERMSREDIQLWATQELFNEYCRRALQAYLQSLPNFHHCLGPNCGFGQIVEGEHGLMMCDSCHFLTCIRHQVPWHTGLTCNEYDMWIMDNARRDGENAASEDLVRATSKPCRRCKTPVRRTVGCDHMTCLCSYQFCYGCGLPWIVVAPPSGPRLHGITCTRKWAWQWAEDGNDGDEAS